MSANQHVYACIVYGTKISFFALYDVETEDFTHECLHPIRPYPHMGHQELTEQEVTIRRTPNNEVYAYEVDARKKSHQEYIHETFIKLSSITGPVDPRVLIPFLVCYCSLIVNLN